jgi:RNA polymerase sigma-70 factor (ECF subfamily)
MAESVTTSPAMQEFEARVREHQSGLRAFIRALGADEAWVDDLAQEAFIVAYRRLDQFEPGTDFGKWLRGIARFLVANERRKEFRRSRLLPFAIVDVLLNCEAETATDPDVPALLRAMRECVDQLPSRSRDLLQQRYAANDNATALARQLGIQADAVRQQLLRIRVAVKECIERKTERFQA